MFVPAGYVKLNGATVNRSNYPRLVALATKYSLWTSDTTRNPGLFGQGNGSTTMVLPNWTGRMAQFAATAGNKVDAGLPNITGSFYARGASNDVFVHVDTGDMFSVSTNTQYNDISSPVSTSAFRNGLRVDLDASKSNTIYGNSTTVQPPAINTFAIMRY